MLIFRKNANICINFLFWEYIILILVPFQFPGCLTKFSRLKILMNKKLKHFTKKTKARCQLKAHKLILTAKINKNTKMNPSKPVLKVLTGLLSNNKPKKSNLKYSNGSNAEIFTWEIPMMLLKNTTNNKRTWFILALKLI